MADKYIAHDCGIHATYASRPCPHCERESCEGSRKDEALTTLAALYGFHAKHLRKMGSCFRDNLELSLDETLPAGRIEELLQTAWKASEEGVGAAVSEGQTPCEHEWFPKFMEMDDCGSMEEIGDECRKCGVFRNDPA